MSLLVTIASTIELIKLNLFLLISMNSLTCILFFSKFLKNPTTQALTYTILFLDLSKLHIN